MRLTRYSTVRPYIDPTWRKRSQRQFLLTTVPEESLVLFYQAENVEGRYSKDSGIASLAVCMWGVELHDWLRAGRDKNSISLGNKTQHLLEQNGRNVKLTPKYGARFAQ
jgi:hypothetical protein